MNMLLLELLILIKILFFSKVCVCVGAFMGVYQKDKVNLEN